LSWSIFYETIEEDVPGQVTGTQQAAEHLGWRSFCTKSFSNPRLEFVTINAEIEERNNNCAKSGHGREFS
jgi:hypothetical protein